MRKPSISRSPRWGHGDDCQCARCRPSLYAVERRRYGRKPAGEADAKTPRGRRGPASKRRGDRLERSRPLVSIDPQSEHTGQPFEEKRGQTA
jgi:hypothetical protein